MALLTVEGIYRDGKVELAETPKGIGEATRVIVTFLPANGMQQVEAASQSTESDESREQVLARVLARMEQGVDLGVPPYPKREELYERLKRYK